MSPRSILLIDPTTRGLATSELWNEGLNYHNLAGGLYHFRSNILA